MGCDIHLFVERLVKGKWVTLDTWEYEEGEDEKELRVPYKKRIYTGRNYGLFALLADVRNDGTQQPICQPKGIPDDVCTEVKAEYERYGSDAHSASHFTLEELFAVDWEFGQPDSGFVPFEEYKRWNGYARKEKESPNTWCGGTTGPKITEEQANAFIASNTTPKGDGTLVAMVAASWVLPRYKVARNFWSDVISRLVNKGKPDEVRLVFFFDN